MDASFRVICSLCTLNQVPVMFGECSSTVQYVEMTVFAVHHV